MKKVLIITYYWPPSGGAGVQRWLKFVKYLRDFGWEPVVYTANNGEIPVIDNSLMAEVPPGVRVIKTDIWEPYSVYKRFIGRKKDDKINASFLSEHKKAGLAEKISVWIRGNFFIPDARRFWIKPSIKHLLPILQAEKIGMVISSGPPHSMHMIAMGLKARMPQLRWVADFRDPWTNIDFYEKLMLSRRADRLHHSLELAVLQKADRVLSIGTTMQDEFKAMLGTASVGKFAVITNGYDDSDVVKTPVGKDQKFSVAHIGTLVKDRNPHILWKVLQSMVERHADFKQKLEIKLVGKVDIAVMESITAGGLMPYVTKIDYLSHDKVIEEQQKSQVLLLLVNKTKNAKGILTGKFFEYMASNTPILAIGPVDGELAAIMQKTGSGLITDFDDFAGLEKNILAMFRGEKMERQESAISQYSRRNLTQALAGLLDDLSR
jgi:glycosyltransferase involved in cell wall biosynthesis